MRLLVYRYDRMRRLDINQSQLGDDRPLGAIRINPAGDLVATGTSARIRSFLGNSASWHERRARFEGRVLPLSDRVWCAVPGSWTNVVKVWDLASNLDELTCLIGHTERVSHVAWKPETVRRRTARGCSRESDTWLGVPHDTCPSGYSTSHGGFCVCLACACAGCVERHGGGG